MRQVKKRILRMFSLFACWVLFLEYQISPPPSPPNILYVAIDDLKPTLGVYGDSLAITPHLDKLGAESFVFLNNHCQQALCGPTRASLLTGLYPDQIQVWGFERKLRDVDFEVLTLPQHFKNEGYHTVGISKIFDFRNVDPYRDSLSWSEPAFPLSEDTLRPYYPQGLGPLAGYFYRADLVHALNDSLINANPAIKAHPEPYLHKYIKPATECLTLPDDAYKDGVYANVAIQKLRELAATKTPFFLALGFERPHLPYTPPKKYWDMYKREEIPLPSFQGRAENDISYAYTNSGSIKSYTDEKGNFIYRKLGKGEELSEAEQRKLLHGYLASVTYIDALVGKVLEALEATGQADNTIIVLWGDHGYHLYDHGIWGKSTNFEQATRSPLMIKAPHMGSGKTQVPTEFTDIFPTLCQLADIPLPSHLSGQDLSKLMKGRESSVKGYAISQFQREEKMGYAIRTVRYRYVEWLAGGKHQGTKVSIDKVVGQQLFDYRIDPDETKNIAQDQTYLDIKKALQTKLRAFYQTQLLEWKKPGRE